MDEYIIEREDYLTVEEYNMLKNELNEIYILIDEMSFDGGYFRYYLYEKRKEYLLMNINSFNDIQSIRVDKNIFKVLNIHIMDYHPDIQMWRLFRRLNKIDVNDILGMKYKLDYYKDKLINVQHFDEHQYFRDTYDIIENLK